MVTNVAARFYFYSYYFFTLKSNSDLCCKDFSEPKPLLQALHESPVRRYFY